MLDVAGGLAGAPARGGVREQLAGGGGAELRGARSGAAGGGACRVAADAWRAMLHQAAGRDLSRFFHGFDWIFPGEALNPVFRHARFPEYITAFSFSMLEREAELESGRAERAREGVAGERPGVLWLLAAAGIGNLRPRRHGPFTVTACPSPDAPAPALPSKARRSPNVNVDPALRACQRPVSESDAGLAGEHGAELLLEQLDPDRRSVRGVTRTRTRQRETSGLG